MTTTVIETLYVYNEIKGEDWPEALFATIVVLGFLYFLYKMII